MTLNYIQWWGFISDYLGNTEFPLSCHNSSVQSDPEWSYLLGSYLWLKRIGYDTKLHLMVRILFKSSEESELLPSPLWGLLGSNIWFSREGVAPSPTPWCSSYRKGCLRVTLDYGRQLYFTFYMIQINLYKVFVFDRTVWIKTNS